MMTPIARTGSSFKGASMYYLHDKDALTKERVGFTQTLNMMTQDADKAHKEMAWTAKHNEELKAAAGIPPTGQKLQKPVFCFALAWHPEQKPDQEHMVASAMCALSHLGLDQHEVLIVEHVDTEYKHIHLICNTVNPKTGKVAELWKCKKDLAKFALGYELADGKIYCHQRLDNAQKRLGGVETNYRDPVIQEAWKQSDNGQSFSSALSEKGYTLAAGKKRDVVVVDKYGKTHNPVRHLEDVRTKEFRERTVDIDISKLGDAKEVAEQVQIRVRQEYHLSREHDKKEEQKKKELQQQQLIERQKLKEQFQEKLHSEQSALNEKFTKAKEEAEILKAKANKTPETFFQKIQSVVYLLSGHKKRDLKNLDLLNELIAETEKRKQEQAQAVEKEKQEALKRQAQQYQAKREFTKEAKPDYYQEEKPPEKSPDQIQKEDAVAAQRAKEIEAFKQQMRERNQQREQNRNRDRDQGKGLER